MTSKEEDIFSDIPADKEQNTEEATQDSANGEEKTEDEEAGLPNWTQDPIVSLGLKEYKNGSLLGNVPLGEKKRYIIGREPSWVDVLLHHPTVSRKQACIVHGTPPGLSLFLSLSLSLSLSVYLPISGHLLTPSSTETFYF